MIDIPRKVTQAMSRDTIGSLNQKITGALESGSLRSMNARSSSEPAPQIVRTPEPVQTVRPQAPQQPARVQPAIQTPRPAQVQPAVQASRPARKMPELIRPLRKGQKTELTVPGLDLCSLRVCFGWDEGSSGCDMDASAFLLDAGGRVPGDDWFVFYGQPRSPDGSVTFDHDPSGVDREVISIEPDRLSPNIRKIVLVLSIDQAFEKHLDFSMMKNVYVRLMNSSTGRELVSFRLEEYFANVTSMTLGEVYLHNGQWKFNPVGNGVRQDLAGQCAIYGVQIG